MKLPTPQYEIGSFVYPRLDPCTDQGGVITGYVIRPGGNLIYLVTNAEGDEKERFPEELTNEVTFSTPRE